MVRRHLREIIWITDMGKGGNISSLHFNKKKLPIYVGVVLTYLWSKRHANV